jgi:hypothetical protein
MSILVQANSTYAQIEQNIRELTASASEASLSTAYIQQRVNTFYNSDFPYAIKVDQMRSVYTFYTQPYIDRYPIDVNNIQGVRSPLYVDGIGGFFYKDRDEFYRMFPRWPTLFNQFGATSATGGIFGITNANPGSVTTTLPHGLTTGNTIYITNVVGMTQVNNNSFLITVTGVNTFTIGVDTTAYSAYVSGGTYYLTPVVFNITLPGPFLSKEVVIGGTDINGNPISIADDGNGNLQILEANPVDSVPVEGSLYPIGTFIGGINVGGYPIPGMYNKNTLNPGLNIVTNVGTVNYVSGAVLFTNPLPLQAGTTLTIRVAQYQTGRPYSMLFWNNELTIRPIPKYIHKVEIETYLTPVQFLKTTDSPILNQWVQYLSYGTSIEILRLRQDMEGVNNLMEGFKRQEALALERQGVEEINQRNRTIFSGSVPSCDGNQWFRNWY